MAIKTFEGDILNTIEGVILQQVNCMFVMGDGLAGQIAAKWPAVKAEYLSLKHTGVTPAGAFGKVQRVRVDENITVLNLFSQFDYGRDPDKSYTSYSALVKCLKFVDANIPYETPIYIPHGYGAGLGGGDWEVIEAIFNGILGYRESVHFIKLPS